MTSPQSPAFFVLDAKHRIGGDVPDPSQAGQVRRLLNRADELLKKAPATPANDAMRDDVTGQLGLAMTRRVASWPWPRSRVAMLPWRGAPMVL